ncbi:MULTISPECIES: hypothetical protein [unclassified Bradyrhizobium]|uniref:hypothetical protein n=1 Tax=unclassified Bradyrhizobium TaxID=2631580 RepID=UPI001CD6095F|nr:MULTISPECIES: hypothetical protein [unclassified Bradyrhizobium]MCA1438465.1 hypothetical protein [Bradyrhizobium sp. BRP20]MCA1473313.1 hypothetical protein [Bradyrhizobium sp. IC3195]MCA1502145.1 hypothetical protein [Bradyrhizobium sp. NBAIM14]MCA1552451.1 hypothetical protein [Bradyrhizobium sp. BRP19]
MALKKAGDAGDGKKARRGEQKTKGVLISSTISIRNAFRKKNSWFERRQFSRAAAIAARRGSGPLKAGGRVGSFRRSKRHRPGW